MKASSSREKAGAGRLIFLLAVRGAGLTAAPNVFCAFAGGSLLQVCRRLRVGRCRLLMELPPQIFRRVGWTCVSLGVWE